GATGTVKSCTTAANVTRIIMNVTLTQPDAGAINMRMFGSHVHVAACNVGQAGGHYRDDAGAGASSTNEFWLDFTTDATGAAMVDKTGTFAIRDGGAKAIVIHASPTDMMGAAGSKL